MSKLDHILRLSKQLISVHSTKDNPQELKHVLDVAKKELEGYYPVEEFISNGIPSILVHNTDKKTRHFKIILNAHLDVVPGKSEQFHPFEKDGKLYGRGAYDMKAAGAVIILVFKDIAKQLNYPLALQLVTDEEIGGFEGTKYQIEKGVTADFVIAGENTNLKINNKAKGILRIKVKAIGTTAHGAYPWLGDNALLRLTKAIDKLLLIYPIPQKASWQTTINVARIETTNSALNKVPDYAEAHLDIRFTPEEKDLVINKIKNEINNNTKIEIIMNEPHQYTKEDTTYIALLKQQIRAEIKKEVEMSAAHGGSDVRFYERLKVPAICFGPVGSGHHADNEYIDIKSLENYYLILKNFLLSLNN